MYTQLAWLDLIFAELQNLRYAICVINQKLPDKVAQIVACLTQALDF